VGSDDGITVCPEPEGVDRGLIGMASKLTQRPSNHAVPVLGSGCDEGSIEIEQNGLHRASWRMPPGKPAAPGCGKIISADGCRVHSRFVRAHEIQHLLDAPR
jgi:hypothetical protein